MLQHLFPKSSTHLSVFLSYANEQRAVAEDIAHALKNAGHQVFFDKDSLTPGSDFNERIRSEISKSDRFVFLLSRHSLGSGRFTLTELGFAKERWPAANGYVLPVLLDEALPMQEVPAYLRSVHIQHVEGNAPAEVAAAVDKTRRLKPLWVAMLALSAMAIVAPALYVAANRMKGAEGSEFKVLRPDQVDFRPMMQPTAANMDWLNSDVAVTIVPVQYSNMSGRPIRIHDENVELAVKGRTIQYKRFNEVEIKPTPCPGDWLCTKKGVGAESLEPGRTLNRDTMFIPAGKDTITWREFLTLVIDETVERADVRFKTSAEISGWGMVSAIRLDSVCHVDFVRLRGQLEAAGYKTVALPPSRLTPFCADTK